MIPPPNNVMKQKSQLVTLCSSVSWYTLQKSIVLHFLEIEYPCNTLSDIIENIHTNGGFHLSTCLLSFTSSTTNSCTRPLRWDDALAAESPPFPVPHFIKHLLSSQDTRCFLLTLQSHHSRWTAQIKLIHLQRIQNDTMYFIYHWQNCLVVLIYGQLYFELFYVLPFSWPTHLNLP